MEEKSIEEMFLEKEEEKTFYVIADMKDPYSESSAPLFIENVAASFWTFSRQKAKRFITIEEAKTAQIKLGGGFVLEATSSNTILPFKVLVWANRL
jgi:hypothetical protein